MTGAGEQLGCPACGRRYPEAERFCADCGLPLTFEGAVDVEHDATPFEEKLRKVNPSYARGDLRQVAAARQQPEAELIQMILLEEGIPSTIKRAVWDVPEMLPAGPRAVYVPESGYEKALEVLDRSEFDVRREDEQLRAAMPSPLALFGGIMVACGIIAVLILLAGG